MLVKETVVSWLLLVVYVFPKAYIRNKLWQYIWQLGSIVNIAWVVAGDVNKPLDNDDKRGGKPVNQNLANKLKS